MFLYRSSTNPTESLLRWKENWATSLTYRSIIQSFDITLFTAIFMFTTSRASRNFAQRIILLLPFKVARRGFFQLLHQWRVCYTFNVHFDFLSQLLSPSSASRSFILALWAFHSLTSNSPAVLGLLIWLPSPLLASQSSYQLIISSHRFTSPTSSARAV